VPSLIRSKRQHQILRIFYSAGNLNDENKQFRILPAINQKLILRGIKIQWTIVGVGKRQEDIEKAMSQDSDIEYFPGCTNAEILKLLQGQDLFLLPSIKEGFPVSIVEAMKAGVVPLVTNWDGATEELIKEGETGFYFKTGDIDNYVETISCLDANRKALNQLSIKAAGRANELFDPYENTEKIEMIFLNAHSSVRYQKKEFKVYGSRLDKKWMPNWITLIIRNIVIIKLRVYYKLLSFK
jgi:glycosyltransferase involved in cell wall biosynthesis